MVPSDSLHTKYMRVTERGSDEEAHGLPDVLQFMQLLWALAHGLERTSKQMVGEIGVTGPQRLVLRVAGLYPGISAGDVASILHVHPSTLTGMIRRLVAQRLLVRDDHPDDRRRAVLHLTRRGHLVNATRHRTVESAVATAIREATPRDRAATRRVLQLLAARLQPPNAAPERTASTRPSRAHAKRRT